MLVGQERRWRPRMAGTRTNALVSTGASAFVMCASLVRDRSQGEAQIVPYVVSGVGFLGAGLVFKESGSVRGLNTAATLWCSAAIGAICGLGYMLSGATMAGVVLLTNVVLRPLAYRMYPAQQISPEAEFGYSLELICPAIDESRMRAPLIQAC